MTYRVATTTSTHMTSTPSIDQLKRAIEISEQIDELESQLAAVLNGSALAEREVKIPRKGRRRRMSPEAREKIAAAQRARWARTKGKSSVKTSQPGRKKRKGGITAAGRAKLAAMMKARWAARKKGAAAPNAKK